MAPELSPLSNDEIYLLTGLAQGDAIVFRLIYQSYERKIYNIAFYYTGSEEDAEDIVQDVFTSLWLRREKIELRGSLENYITRCAKYTAFFYLKMRQKKKQAQSRSVAVVLPPTRSMYCTITCPPLLQLQQPVAVPALRTAINGKAQPIM